MHPNLLLWVASNVRACAVLFSRNGESVGSGYRVASPHISTWKPRALVETDLLLNKAVDRKLKRDKITVQVPQRKNKGIILEGPCAYGCPTTTYTDDKGVRKWQRPPFAVKHLFEDSKVVCQRCYTILARGSIPMPSNPANIHERPPGHGGAEGAQFP